MAKHRRSSCARMDMGPGDASRADVAPCVVCGRLTAGKLIDFTPCIETRWRQHRIVHPLRDLHPLSAEAEKRMAAHDDERIIEAEGA